MPPGRVWMYSPHPGGKKIPEHVRQSTARRIEAFAVEHFAGRYRLRDTISAGSASMATRIVGRSPSTATRPAATSRRCCSPATTTARPRGRSTSLPGRT